MKINELLDVKKDNFFSGAIQAEWYYNAEKRKKVSESYIFHGPKYYGVSNAEVKTVNHKLCDTITFTKTIYNKIYNDKESSRFLLTIAGYGSGKSHLSLTLATLLSGIDKESKRFILKNIEDADKDEYDEIYKYTKEDNLVLVLNGINDFNLNREILKVAKESLDLFGLDSDIFEDMGEAYNTARIFLKNSYNHLYDKYQEEANKVSEYGNLSKEELYINLLKDIEKYKAYNIINKVYKLYNGNEIRMDEAISASSVLNRLHKRYVIGEKRFKSIIIFFDEFGRYLEFASSQPGIAGETAIQQIFEAVQNASPSMLFIGFIQSDLSAYISRVNNENIIRYVGRYQNSDKYYLSSNLETVLASIIIKRNNAEKIIDGIFDNTLNNFKNKIYENILRWQPEFKQKSVWSNKDMFIKTILKGCYPIHPITTCMMVNLSSYMQQRSTLSFFSDIFETYKGIDIDEKIPFIYPIELINSPIFNELINAEERGRISGQSASQYKDLCALYDESLDDDQKQVLAAILIIILNKFKVYDISDCNILIMSITGMQLDEVEMISRQLENRLGIIYFDQDLNRYNFVVEGNSKVDFNKKLIKKKLTTSRNDLISSISEEIKKELKFGSSELTDFGRRNYINTNEWSYIKEFIDINEFTEDIAINIKNNLDKSIHPDDARGRVIYLYVTGESYDRIKVIQKIIVNTNLDNSAILLGIINDNDGDIEESLFELRALNSFTVNEKEDFKKFYIHKKNELIKKIIRSFMVCASKKQYINENGIFVASISLQKEMSNKFGHLYTKTIPFVIDGFEKKIVPKTRKYYYTIIENLLQDKLKYKVDYDNIQREIKNRIESIFSVNMEKSWKILNDRNVITEPLQPVVAELYKDLYKTFINEKRVNVNFYISKLTKQPFGLNIYSATLLIVYFIYLNKENIVLFQGLNKIKFIDLMTYFNDEKKEKFSEFRKLKIEYIDKIECNKAESIIRKIEEQGDIPIDKILEYYEEFKNIEQADIEQDLIGRYYNLENTLKIASKKNEEIQRTLDKNLHEIEKLKLNPFSIKIILKELMEIKEGIIEGSIYRYSLNQIKKSNKLQEKALNLFKNIIVTLDKRIKISDRKNCEVRYNNLIKFFKSFGNEEFIELTEFSYNNYLNRCKIENEITKILDKLNADIKKIEINIKVTENLEESESIITQWLNKPISENIRERVREPINELSDLKNKIEKIRSDSKDVINEIKRSYVDIKSIADINRFITNNLGKLDLRLLPETKKQIKCINEKLSDIKLKCEKYENKLINIKELTGRFDQIMKLYENDIDLCNMIENIKQTCIEYVEELQNKWIKKYITDFDNIENLSINELREWENKAYIDLEYFSDKCVNMYNDMNKKVSERIDVLNIDNIQSIFKELSRDEKLKCIELLKKYI